METATRVAGLLVSAPPVPVCVTDQSCSPLASLPGWGADTLPHASQVAPRPHPSTWAQCWAPNNAQ